MESIPSDYASVWDGFEPISVRLTREQRTARAMAVFLSKRASIEDNYAKSLLKLSKLPLGKGETGMLETCIQALKEEAEDRGKVHLDFAVSMKAEAKSLDQFIGGSKKNCNSTLNSGLKMTKALAVSKVTEAKSKERYFKIAGQSTNDEKAAKKVDEYNREYQKRVDLLKTAQSSYYSGMPSLLSALQSTDEGILERLESSWNTLITNLELMLPTLNALANSLKRNIESFDRTKEIQDFIATIYSGEEKPPMATYQPYDSPTRATSPTMRGGASPYGTMSGGSAMGSSFGATGPSTYNSGGGGGSKVPYKKTSRLSAMFSGPTSAVANMNADSYYDQSNFLEKSLQKQDQYSKSGPSASYKAEALYDWVADDPEAISLTAGDILEVNAEESGWLFGVNSKGQSGRFPASYVQYI